MSNRKSRASIAGILLATVCVYSGYLIRGSDVENSARLAELKAMSASLADISSKLPLQKIVEVEKVVEKQSTFCTSVEQAMKVHKNKLDGDGLTFCKELMFGDGRSIQTTNLYDAISRWTETSSASPGSLEDRIMSHVLTVLIDCFQRT